MLGEESLILSFGRSHRKGRAEARRVRSHVFCTLALERNKSTVISGNQTTSGTRREVGVSYIKRRTAVRNGKCEDKSDRPAIIISTSVSKSSSSASPPPPGRPLRKRFTSPIMGRVLISSLERGRGVSLPSISDLEVGSEAFLAARVEVDADTDADADADAEGAEEDASVLAPAPSRSRARIMNVSSAEGGGGLEGFVFISVRICEAWRLGGLASRLRVDVPEPLRVGTHCLRQPAIFLTKESIKHHERSIRNFILEERGRGHSRCISYSSSSERGSLAVSSLRSAFVIHSWYVWLAHGPMRSQTNPQILYYFMNCGCKFQAHQYMLASMNKSQLFSRAPQRSLERLWVPFERYR